MIAVGSVRRPAAGGEREGESGDSTLAARDARWCRREATKEEEAKDCWGPGEEEVEVDCGDEDRTEAGA